jgi:alanine dehydrogenase
MKVVFLKENKCENRIAITPEQVKTLSANFEIFVAKNYGAKFGYTNEHYTNSGAQMMTKHDIKNANLIVKLSALTFSELNSIKKASQILITNMFLANNTPYLKTLLKHSITSLGIEIFHKNNVYP